MHFSFNLLRIKGHLHVSSITCSFSGGDHKRYLVYCMRIAVLLQPSHSQLTLYARNIPSAVCVESPDDEQVMLETYRGPLILNKLNKKYIALVSLY
jgi:hypothetical protein